PVLRKLVCDGKDLYSYREVENYYGKDRAPKDLAGFREAAISLEMAAITGIDPFAGQTQSMRLDEPVSIEGALSDVVVLNLTDEIRASEVRLYVARSDHLLRRF